MKLCRGGDIHALKRHPWLAAATVVAVAFGLYYASIPALGPHFAKVCYPHPAQGAPACEYWDIVTARALEIFYFIDGHEGFFTFLTGAGILLFTGTLWFSTDKLWNASEQQFRLAHDEFVATHRPRLVARGVWPRHPRSGVRDNNIVVTFWLHNVGINRANVVEFQLSVQFTEREDIPFPITTSLEVTDIVYPVRVHSGHPIQIECVGDIESDVDWTSKGTSLELVGSIFYEDVKWRRFELGFHRKFDRDAFQFRVVPDSDSEYSD